MVRGSDFVFKINITFLGYFDPVHIFLAVKVNNFRGDLNDVLAKTNVRPCIVRGSDFVFKIKLNIFGIL